MGNLLKYAKLLSLLPLLSDVIDFIRDAQATFRGPGNNSTKLQHVVEKLVPVVKDATDAGLIPAGIGNAIIEGAPFIVSLIVQILKVVPGGLETPAPSPSQRGANAVYATVLLAKPKDSDYLPGDHVYTNASQWYVLSGVGTPGVPTEPPAGYLLDHVITN